MAVATAATIIRTLHRIQQQLTDLRGRLDAGPRQIAAGTRQLQAAETACAELAGELTQAQKRYDTKQLQLRSAEAKVADLEAKRNTAKTNKEYQLLGEQIEADQMAIKVLEDEILEALEQVDELRGRQPAAADHVNQVTATLEALKQRIAAETVQLEQEVNRVTGQLREAESDLTDDLRELYQRVVKHKGEDGMTTVDAGCCGGCHQQLTGKLISQLLVGAAVMCRSCGRLLYDPDQTA
jgi:Zn-ribbon protein, possibly nucleic acid-binding